MTLPMITSFTHGVSCYLKGLQWLKKRPRFALLLFLPMLTACLVLVASWSLLVSYQEMIFTWFLFPKPDTFWMTFLYYLLRAFAYVVSLVAGLILCLLVNNIVAAPVYDFVSQKVEKDYAGIEAEPASLWHSLLLIGEEIKKSLFVFLASLIFLLTPGLNLLSPLAAAFFFGWEFYDYPFARRSWRFRQRFLFTMKHFWSVTGLGLFLCIPFLQIFLMPLAVVGGTMLATEHLKQKT